jgi:hypothetical protein
MASIIQSGSKNATYTNGTGQNVRVVINYMSDCTKMTWAGVSTVTSSSTTIIKGRDLTNFPSEIVLGATETFSCICNAYNIVIIKEDGT